MQGMETKERTFPENIEGISLAHVDGTWKYIDVQADLKRESLQNLLAAMPRELELCFFEYSHGDQIGDTTGMYVMVQVFEGYCLYWKGNHGRTSELQRMRFAEMAAWILENVKAEDAFLYLVPMTRRFETRQDFRWQVAPVQAYDDQAEILRHSLATTYYRLKRAVGGSTAEFGDFEAGGGVRKPREILHHMRQVMEFTRAELSGEARIRTEPLAWEDEIQGFYATLAALDQVLLTFSPNELLFKKLFQGPFSDVLTHVGQISMLRRMYGEPVTGESYFRAKVPTGYFGEENS